jgi:hypothetical protein
LICSILLTSCLLILYMNHEGRILNIVYTRHQLHKHSSETPNASAETIAEPLKSFTVGESIFKGSHNELLEVNWH